MAKNKKIVLAYSGGLDTSVILKWLLEKGFEVVCYIADVGQADDFEAAKAKALKIGASKVFIEDLKREFVTDFIYPAFRAGALYEGRYLLGTSLARPVIAKRHVEIAESEDAAYVGHGATGKGNDQVRFELAYYSLHPEIQVLAPWKTPEFLAQFKGRSDMLAYAEKHGIPVSATTKKPYSEDDNFLHISHEAGVLEDPGAVCAEDVYSRTTSPEKAPDVADVIEITYKAGTPVSLKTPDGKVETDPVGIFVKANDLGTKHGIGRLDMVENRYVGIKSRGVYETPGGTILFQALRDLEGITMDREVLRLRQEFALKLADLIYYGYWFSPEFDVLMTATNKATERVDGTVTVKLFKGSAYPIARTSPVSRYDAKLSSMDEEGGFNQMDSQGFIKINAIRLKANRILLRNRK